MEDFSTLQKEINEWAEKTFPTSTIQSILKHLDEEIIELKEAQNIEDIADEISDIVMMLFHLASKKEFNLLEEVRNKIKIVKKRTWLPPDEDGVVKHVKESEEFITKDCLDLSYSPWTSEQIKSLNNFQDSNYYHSFTCGTEGCGSDLVATTEGWVCPVCGLWKQKWAHKFMTDDSWKHGIINFLNTEKERLKQ